MVAMTQQRIGNNGAGDAVVQRWRRKQQQQQQRGGGVPW
jgi:hypothetical protein